MMDEDDSGLSSLSDGDGEQAPAKRVNGVLAFDGDADDVDVAY